MEEELKIILNIYKEEKNELLIKEIKEGIIDENKKDILKIIKKNYDEKIGTYYTNLE